MFAGETPAHPAAKLPVKAMVLVCLLFLFGGMHFEQRHKKPSVVTNKPPLIAKFESSSAVVNTCGGGFCRPKARQTVSLSVTASDPENDPVTYQYSITGGEIIGDGSSVSWKLGKQPFGHYTATVKVKDDKGGEATSTLQVVVEGCWSCFIPDPPCPVVTVEVVSEYTDPTETFRGEVLSFHATVMTEAHFLTRPDYVWRVTGGKILQGQHTPWLKVEATGDVGSSVTATVEVEGFDLSCVKTGGTSVPIKK